ncbi:MAG: alpha/beta fold hydrolase [Burkholderiales bacterium]
MKHTFVASDGVRIAYYVDDFTDPWRQAPILLMIHSAMSSARRFYSMVPGLARQYRVVRMDSRGHGESQVPPPDVPHDKERITQDVLELLGVLGADKVHIIGGSAGGYTAQLLAINHPDRVKSLVLFSSTPGFKGEQGKGWLREAAQRGMRPVFAETIDERMPVAETDPRLVEWVLDQICRNDLKFLERFIGHWTDTDFMNEVARIRCPTLIVEPGAHTIGTGSAFEEMEKRIAGSERLVYENGRHNLYDYLPDRCVADTLDFLRRHFPEERTGSGEGVSSSASKQQSTNTPPPAARAAASEKGKLMALSSEMHEFTASDGLKLKYALDDYSDPWRPQETLILMHAAMGSSRRLYKWVPILARHFRVVRPDMRGHGQSAIPGPDQLSVGRLAKDVVELADHLGCKKFHVAGSSAGAIVAMQTTLDYPDRVKTLTNFASTPGLKNSLIDMNKWVREIRAKGIRGFLEETIHERFPDVADAGFLRWFIDESAKTDADLFCRFGPMMKEVDQTARLREIKCPMLNVVPGHDPLGAPGQYEVYRKQVPHCEFMVYEGLPHNITDSVPERCAEDLLRFLLKHRAP